jgi:hypothetical protein
MPWLRSSSAPCVPNLRATARPRACEMISSVVSSNTGNPPAKNAPSFDTAKSGLPSDENATA